MALSTKKRYYKVIAAAVWPFDASAETYGTKVDVGVEVLGVTPQYDTDRGREFAVVTDGLAVLTQDQLSWAHHGFTTTALEVIKGITYDESGSGASESRASRAHAGEDNPYFGAGFVLALDGGESEIRYYPRCKMMGDSGLQFNEANAYVRPQLSVDAFVWKKTDGTKYDLFYKDQGPGELSLASAFITAVDALKTRTTT